MPQPANVRVAWRLAIVAGALLAAAVVFLSQGPSNARVAMESARKLVEQGEQSTDPAIQILARRILRRDATMPAAIELVALAMESLGNRSAAARLFHLSDRISRRSLATRLWLIQESVDHGDVAGTLAQMDIALRTSSAAPKVVFPALGSGLDEPKLIKPIASLLDRPSEWREAFLAYATDNADPRSAAVLLLALRNQQAVRRDELDRKLTLRLVESGQFSLARKLDAAFAARPRSAELVLDGTFGDEAARYPFGWGLTDTAELGASREVRNGRPALAYHANTAEGGQVAAQLLTLPGGSYLLDTQAAPSKRSHARATWTLTCAGTGRTIVMLTVDSAERAHSPARFSISAECPAQWLTLAIRPALVPQSGWINTVTIAPE